MGNWPFQNGQFFLYKSLFIFLDNGSHCPKQCCVGINKVVNGCRPFHQIAIHKLAAPVKHKKVTLHLTSFNIFYNTKNTYNTPNILNT